MRQSRDSRNQGNKLLKLKEDFESKSYEDNLGKTKIIVSGGITNDGMSKSKVDPCGVCSLRVKANSVLCVQCGKWIRIEKCQRNYTCKKCEGNIGEAVEQEGNLCDEVETVGEFTYLGDR